MGMVVFNARIPGRFLVYFRRGLFYVRGQFLFILLVHFYQKLHKQKEEMKNKIRSVK